MRYLVTIREAENLPKRAKGKFVYVTWKRGGKADNKGETRYASCSGGSVTWNEPFEITSSLIRDEATGTFKTKSKKLVFRIMFAGDNSTERKKKADKKDKKSKGDASKTEEGESKKDKKLSGAQRHKLRGEHKEFASIYIDLVEYAKDGTNVQEDLALNSTDPPAALSLRVESTWIKVGKHLLKRLDNKSGASSSSAAASGSSAASSSSAATAASSSSSSAGASGAAGADVMGGGALGRTVTIDGVDYEAQTELYSSDSDDCTTMPTMTGMEHDSEGTDEDFSDDGDPFGDNDDDDMRFSGLTASMSDSRLAARRGSIGTASECGVGQGRKNKSLMKTSSVTNMKARLKRSKLPLVPKNVDVPRILPNTVAELCDALHYVVFLPIEQVWGLQHSPQDLLEIVRLALALTQTDQDRSLDRVLPSCNYENTLVQLDRQLRGVGSHRFYGQDAFPSGDLFRGWKESETARIQRLVDRIYKNIDGIEPIAALDAQYERFSSYDFHSLYRTLNKSLHYYDTVLNKKINHEVFVLAGPSTWLLKEFGERYQVNPLFRALSMLDLLISYWCPSPPRLMLLQILLMKLEQMLGEERLDMWLSGGPASSSTAQASNNNNDEEAGETPLAPANAGKAFLTKAEKAFLGSLLGDLDTRLHDTISEFFRFSTDPQTSPIKALNQILQTTINLEATIGLPDRSFDELVLEWMREGLSNMYDKMVKTASGRGNQNNHDDQSDDEPPPITVAQMFRVSEMVIEGLHTLDEYTQFFPFELPGLGARGFVKWYHEDLVNLCTTAGSRVSAKEMIELAGIAKNVGTELAKVGVNITIPVNLAPLFDPYVNGYLIETLNDQRAHVEAVVADDKWVAANDDTQSTSTLIPTLTFLSSPLNFILKYDFLGGGTFETRFGSYVVDPLIGFYLQQLYRSLVAALPGSTSKIALRLCEAVPPADLIRSTADLPSLLSRVSKIRGDVSVVEGSVKPPLAVRVNTIVAVSGNLKDFFTIPNVDNVDFASSIESITANAERYASAVVTLLACWICTDVLKDVKNWLKKASKATVEAVKTSILIYVQGLAPPLTSRAMLALLQSLWKAMLVAVKDAVASNGKIKPKHLDKARACTDGLLDIFDQAGSNFGLDPASLRSQLAELFNELEALARK